MSGSRQRKERLYHIDDSPSGIAEVIQDLDRSYEMTTNMQATADPICCLTVSENMLIIGRESGTLQRYSLPQVALTNRYNLNCCPYEVAINCNSILRERGPLLVPRERERERERESTGLGTNPGFIMHYTEVAERCLAVIDVTGILRFLNLEASTSSDDNSNMSLIKNVNNKDLSKFERKDVWAMKWATDNSELIAIMEKTRMYVLKEFEPEEPIVSSGYICSFQDLEIRAVLLDEIMQNPERPLAEHILDLEVKSLRDTRDLLVKVGISEATAFVEEHFHPRLWYLNGIQFIKRLYNIESDVLKRAEINAYFKHFNDAEKLYLEADRGNLAILLREKLGDWFRVVQLMKMGKGGSDVLMEEAWNNIGDFFADRQNWWPYRSDAREYYEKGHNLKKCVECYYMLEDYDALKKCSAGLAENHPLLPTIADMFTSVGMCFEAVAAYVKCGQVKNGVDACVGLNQWDQAIDLAKKYKLPEIGTLLRKYATHLLEKGRILEAVELYRKANHFVDAAILLHQDNKPKVQEVEECRSESEKNPEPKGGVMQDRRDTRPTLRDQNKMLLGLLESDIEANIDSRMVDNTWRGAEAYHFFMLAQKQLYEDVYTNGEIMLLETPKLEESTTADGSTLLRGTTTDKHFIPWPDVEQMKSGFLVVNSVAVCYR
uniref:Uncharacterized protein n=1 Tax=Timema shepardi TaxID=629360 RepID=A0A7R9AWT2_TIMSH|nr:unnamed protein product [Timema shepardi]